MSAKSACYAAALAAVDAAPINGATYRTARRLLDRVGKNGLCCLTKPEMLVVCSTGSEYTLRRHLADLRKANLIHYSISQRVFVGFLAWEREATATCSEPAVAQLNSRGSEQNLRANEQAAFFRSSLAVARPPATVPANAQPVLAAAQKPRAAVQPVAVADTNGHTRGVCLSVCSDPDLSLSLDCSSDKQTNIQTNIKTNTAREAQPAEPAAPPSPQAAAGPNRTEEERSFALLTDPDVGVAGFRARQLAAQHPFPHLLTHVFCYLRDLNAGRVNGTGALLRRIDQDYGGSLTLADRDTPLWRRHVTVEDEAAWNAADEAEQRHRKYDISRFGLN